MEAANDAENLWPFALFIEIILKLAAKIVKSYIVFQTGRSKENEENTKMEKGPRGCGTPEEAPNFWQNPCSNPV